MTGSNAPPMDHIMERKDRDAQDAMMHWSDMSE